MHTHIITIYEYRDIPYKFLTDEIKHFLHRIWILNCLSSKKLISDDFFVFSAQPKVHMEGFFVCHNAFVRDAHCNEQGVRSPAKGGIRMNPLPTKGFNGSPEGEHSNSHIPPNLLQTSNPVLISSFIFTKSPTRSLSLVTGGIVFLISL